MLPTDRFGSLLELIDPRTAVVIAAPEELDAALDDHLTDVRAAIHDDDVAKLYVAVRDPLRERAALCMTSVADGDAEAAASKPSGPRSPSPRPAASARRSRSSRSRPAPAT